MTISPDQEEYILFALTESECRLRSDDRCGSIPLRGWADQPNHPVLIADLPSHATLNDWLDWTAQSDRRIRPTVMEWILMDPARGRKFLGNISSSTAFRKKFGGLYVPVTSALERLGGERLKVPPFIVEKVERVKVALFEHGQSD